MARSLDALAIFRSGSRPGRGLAIAILALLLGVAAPARAVSDREVFVSAEWLVELELPAGWSWSAQATYPGILVAAVHRSQTGARMTLAVERATPGDTARSTVEKTRTTLLAAGFLGGRILPHPSGALVLDVTTGDQRTSVRQATYLHHGNLYVLTLAAPLANVRQLARGFDATLRRMVDGVRRRHEEVTPVAEPPAPGPAAPAREP